MGITPKEEARRRKAWEKACVSTALEGLERNPEADEWLEEFFIGNRSKEDTMKGLIKISKGLSPYD